MITLDTNEKLALALEWMSLERASMVLPEIYRTKLTAELDRVQKQKLTVRHQLRIPEGAEVTYDPIERQLVWEE